MTALVLIMLASVGYFLIACWESQRVKGSSVVLPLVDDGDEDQPANLIALGCVGLAGIAFLYSAIRLGVYLITGA